MFTNSSWLLIYLFSHLFRWAVCSWRAEPHSDSSSFSGFFFFSAPPASGETADDLQLSLPIYLLLLCIRWTTFWGWLNSHTVCCTSHVSNDSLCVFFVLCEHQTVKIETILIPKHFGETWEVSLNNHEEKKYISSKIVMQKNKKLWISVYFLQRSFFCRHTNPIQSYTCVLFMCKWMITTEHWRPAGAVLWIQANRTWIIK